MTARLPGQIDLPNGKHVYECVLCNDRSDIFGGQFISEAIHGTFLYRVCHNCLYTSARKAIINKTTPKVRIRLDCPIGDFIELTNETTHADIQKGVDSFRQFLSDAFRCDVESTWQEHAWYIIHCKDEAQATAVLELVGILTQFNAKRLP